MSGATQTTARPKMATGRVPPPPPKKPVGSASQLDGPTARVQGASMGGSQVDDHEHLQLCVMCIEVHARSRDHLMPDPRYDPVLAFSYCLRVDEAKARGERDLCGVVVVTDDKCDVEEMDMGGGGDDEDDILHEARRRRRRRRQLGSRVRDGRVTQVESERALVDALVALVLKWDPDFVGGYEVHKLSLGYLLQRAQLAYKLDLCSELSRTPFSGTNKFDEGDAWGRRKTNSIHIAGRLVLNVWRLMRKEVALNIYTFENVCWRILQRRVPHYSFRSLSDWFDDGALRSRTLDHCLSRAVSTMELLDKVPNVNNYIFCSSSHKKNSIFPLLSIITLYSSPSSLCTRIYLLFLSLCVLLPLSLCIFLYHSLLFAFCTPFTLSLNVCLSISFLSFPFCSFLHLGSEM